jgi:CheY-like chemotaxis protein
MAGAVPVWCRKTSSPNGYQGRIPGWNRDARINQATEMTKVANNLQSMVHHTGSNRLLALDDEDQILDLIGRMAVPLGFDYDRATTAADFLAQLESGLPSVVIIDLFLHGHDEDAVRVIQHLGKKQFRGAVILISGFDYRLLRFVERLARDHGLHVLGTVEKGGGLDKITALLKAALV